jgi:hypothetical protein
MEERDGTRGRWFGSDVPAVRHEKRSSECADRLTPTHRPSKKAGPRQTTVDCDDPAPNRHARHAPSRKGGVCPAPSPHHPTPLPHRNDRSTT